MSEKLNEKLLNEELKKAFSPLEKKRLEHIFNWPEAKRVFNGLEEEEKEALRLIVSGKSWVLVKRYPHEEADKIIVKLRKKGLVKQNEVEVFRGRTDVFHEHIYYRQTLGGKFRLLPRRLLRRELKDWLSFFRPNPLLHTWFAMLLLLVPSFGATLLLVSSLRASFEDILEPWNKILDSYRSSPWIFLSLVFIISLLFIFTYFSHQRLRLPLALTIVVFLLLIIIVLLLPWLGFEPFVIIPLLISGGLEVWGFHHLHRAYQLAESLGTQRPRSLPDEVYQFLKLAVKKETWQLKNIREWPLAKMIIFLLLLIPGFLLFIHTLAPREKGFEGTNLQSIESTVLYPAWLSYRDTAELLITLRTTESMTGTESITGTILLEPEPGIPLMVVADEETKCDLLCDWGPLWLASSQDQKAPLSQTLRWRLYTPPLCSFGSDARWKLHLKICELPPHGKLRCDDDEISIPKLRLGFGLWGFLQGQPLVNIISMLFSIVYAVLGIWLSRKLVFRE